MTFLAELPVIQAPMAGSQGSALALAVANAGGLGSLPCALLAPDAIRAELSAITSATGKPYNVNFFVHREPVVDAARESAWRAVLAPYYRELGVNPAATPPLAGRTRFDEDTAAVLEAVRPPAFTSGCRRRHCGAGCRAGGRASSRRPPR